MSKNCKSFKKCKKTSKSKMTKYHQKSPIITKATENLKKMSKKVSKLWKRPTIRKIIRITKNHQKWLKLIFCLPICSQLTPPISVSQLSQPMSCCLLPSHAAQVHSTMSTCAPSDWGSVTWRIMLPVHIHQPRYYLCFLYRRRGGAHFVGATQRLVFPGPPATIKQIVGQWLSRCVG